MKNDHCFESNSFHCCSILANPTRSRDVSLMNALPVFQDGVMNRFLRQRTNIPAHPSQRSYICKMFCADVPPALLVTRRCKNSNYRYRERGLYGFYWHKT